MQRRINKSIDVYLTTFKDAVFKKGEDPEITVADTIAVYRQLYSSRPQA